MRGYFFAYFLEIDMALRTSLVAQPHLYMGDTQGRPLDAGKVYFGEPNKDPELYPINVFYDEALTIAAPQPIRTMGGFMNANGQMVEIYAAEIEYSVRVLDEHDRQVFYQAEMSSTSTSASVSTKLPYPNAVSRTQEDVNSDVISVKGFTSAKIANDHAVTQDGKIYLPNGFYDTDADVDMTNFWGSGVITNTVNNKVFSRPDDAYVMPEFYGITDEDATSGMHTALDKGYVRLNSGSTYKVNGTYSINKDIIIDGNNATLVGSDNTVMQVFADCTITIRNLSGSGFKNLIKNTGNFKVKIDFQGCDFTEVKKLVDFSSAGSLAFYLKDNKFSKMYSVIWAICAIKGSLAEYNEFTEMANDHTNLTPEHMNVFRLGNTANLVKSGLVVFRNNEFVDIQGGAVSGTAYVAAIFSCVRYLVCETNLFKDIRGAEGAVEHKSRAIYSYGFNDKIINNTFTNAGRYDLVTVKGELSDATAPAIFQGNTIHQDFELTNGGITIESAYNAVIKGNTWTGNYAKIRVGSTGYQYGILDFSSNVINTVNTLTMSFSNMQVLHIKDNLLSRVSRSTSADDNVIRLYSASGMGFNSVVISGNTIETPSARGSASTNRSFIEVNNGSFIKALSVTDNTLVGDAVYDVNTLKIDDTKDATVVFARNIIADALVPNAAGGGIISHSNIYNGVLESVVPTP